MWLEEFTPRCSTLKYYLQVCGLFWWNFWRISTTDHIRRSCLFSSSGYHFQVTFQNSGPYLHVLILIPRFCRGGWMCQMGWWCQKALFSVLWYGSLESSNECSRISHGYRQCPQYLAKAKRQSRPCRCCAVTLPPTLEDGGRPWDRAAIWE